MHWYYVSDPEWLLWHCGLALGGQFSCICSHKELLLQLKIQNVLARIGFFWRFKTVFPLVLIITLTIYVTTDNVCSLKISFVSTSGRMLMTRRRIFREEKTPFSHMISHTWISFFPGYHWKFKMLLTSGFERSDCKYIFDLKTTVQWKVGIKMWNHFTALHWLCLTEKVVGNIFPKRLLPQLPTFISCGLSSTSELQTPHWLAFGW